MPAARLCARPALAVQGAAHLLGWLLYCGVALALSTETYAEPLPTVPMLRIETGRHTAFIHALAIDEIAGRLYSASEDKTVRVWRVSDGRLLDTFRMPAGLRAEGQLYALALSPDRRVLAAGGWTCWDTDGAACVYLIDATTGALLGRLTGLTEVIATLRFSPDGSRLAVGLMGSQGLRVFNLRDRSGAAQDAAYRDKLLELDFAPDGRLVATSLDGFVRLYDERLQLIGRVDAGLAGRQPFGVRYSPDGQFVAVGFNDTAGISILRAADLTPVQTLRVASAAAPRNLTRVAWSHDGSAIYGAGESDRPIASTLFRWNLADPRQAQPIPGVSGRVGDLVVTRDGRVLFGADDPALISIDANGQRRYVLGSGIPDYRDARDRFRVSRDGRSIEVPLSRAPGPLRRFTVGDEGRGRRDAVAGVTFSPLLAAPGWKLKSTDDGASLAVNGKGLPLEPYERVRSHAFEPSGASLFVGTEWALRAFDRALNQKWSARMVTAVRAVNATADGRFVLVALADGAIHWYSAQSGALVLSCFLHADGQGWVAWTPSGAYASSAYGDLLVGWQINRGPQALPDFFRAVQFERELYRPDIVARRLESFGRDVRNSTDADASQMPAIAPPRLSFTIERAGRTADPTAATLRVSGESAGLPMRDIAVYVNDIPIISAREHLLAPAESSRFLRNIPLAIGQADSEIRVEVFNGRSLGVAERFVPGSGGAAVAAPRGDLYVLAVGANQFPELSPSQYLSYAASDAEAFAQAIQAYAGRAFRKVSVQTLSDRGPAATKLSVLAALQSMVNRSTGNDTIIVFLASHGISDAAGNYFFVPRDVRRTDLDALLDGKSLPAESSLIGWLPFFEMLRSAAGRRLLIVDTCQARNISGRFQDYALVKRSASSHIAFILASRGDEESQELTPAQHGLFTYGLLEGLRTGAARGGAFTVSQWFDYAAGVVEKLRDRRIGPQTPQLIAPASLRAMPVPTAVR